MRRPANRVTLDPSDDVVCLNGHPIELQHKASRVLVAILRRAPDRISRRELIDEIWSGNYLIGERGLNQALWVIRAALGDSARQPVLIRTIPREGFQWIGESIQSAPHRSVKLGSFSIAASACLSIIGLTVALSTPGSDISAAYTLPVHCAIHERGDVTAYQRRRDVVVDIENGCRLIATPEGGKEFGEPVVSADGRHVAFTVTEDHACHFVTVALQDGARTEFDRC